MFIKHTLTYSIYSCPNKIGIKRAEGGRELAERGRMMDREKEKEGGRLCVRERKREN